MSEQQTNMTPEQAYEVLVAQVHAPVFFQKLASVYGIRPGSPEEAHGLLQLAGQLRNVHETENTKAASANGGFISEALSDLQQVLTQHGYPVPQDVHYKQAAVGAAQVPLLREAALVFQHHLSNQS